jgi:hypothetical protein
MRLPTLSLELTYTPPYLPPFFFFAPLFVLAYLILLYALEECHHAIAE